MKIVFFLIILYLIPIETWCQYDTTYYFGINGNMDNIQKPEIKKEITYVSEKKIVVETFNMKDGNWISILSEKIMIENKEQYRIQIKYPGFSETVVRVFEKLGENKFAFIDRLNKKIIRTGITSSKIPLILNGEVTEYYKNGNKKSISIYEDNKLVCNKNWLINGEHYIDSIFYSVDKEPLYKSGISILHAYVRNAFLYSEADISQLSGRIVVGFVVLKDGSIDGIQIEEGMNRRLNTIARDVFRKLPDDWQPALLDGKEVRYYQLFPVNFIYKKKDFDFTELKGRVFNWGK